MPYLPLLPRTTNDNKNDLDIPLWLKVFCIVWGVASLIFGICLVSDMYVRQKNGLPPVRAPTAISTLRYRMWYEDNFDEAGQPKKEPRWWQFWLNKSASKDAGMPLSTRAEDARGAGNEGGGISLLRHRYT